LALAQATRTASESWKKTVVSKAVAMQLDLVIGGMPKRLIEAEGAWTLVVSRQVAVDRNVYRPELRQLAGREAILSYLRQDPQHENLAHGALELLRLQGDGKPRRYEVINGEWVPAEFIAKYAGPRKPAARPAPSDRAKLVSVQAECLRLRHVVSDLSLRVAYLENLILKGQTGGALPVATSSGPSPHGDAGASAAASPSASGPSSAPGHGASSMSEPPLICARSDPSTWSTTSVIRTWSSSATTS
jgi:hypothetical protein